MRVLLLAGLSAANKPWSASLADALVRHCPVTVLHYNHWDADGDFSLPEESKKARALFTDDTVLVCKSFGCLVALHALHHDASAAKVKSCIFLGFPLHWARKQHLDILPWLAGLRSRLSYPCTFIQNEQDPAGNVVEIEELIQQSGLTDATLVNTPGSTHDYVDFSVIKDELVK